MSASASGIRAGRAFIELGGSDSELQKMLDRGAARVKAFAGQINRIGTELFAAGSAIAAPLIAAATAFAEAGSKVASAAARTGMSAEKISTLGYAAQQSGSSLESLEGAILKMNKNLYAAAGGSAKAQEALAQLRLSVADLSHLSPEARFKLIADRLSQLKDPAERSAVAMQVFGKGAAEMLPLINQGAAGIDALQKKAQALGLEMSGEEAASALQFSHSLSTLWDVLQHGTEMIGSAVAPMLQKAATLMTAAAVAATRWIKEHRSLIQTALLVGGAIAAVGAMLMAGAAILTGLAAAASVAGAAFGALVGTVAMLLTPLGAIAAGLALVISVTGQWGSLGSWLANTFTGAFQQIWKAISFVFDNTGTAAEAWGALMEEAGFMAAQAWLTVKGLILNAWTSLKGYAADIWTSIGGTILGAAYGASRAFLNLWAQTVYAWQTLVGTAANAIQDHFMANQESESKALLARVDELEKSGQLTHDQAEKNREGIKKDIGGYDTNARSKASEERKAQLQASLDGVKAEYDAKQAALAQLVESEHAANAKATAEDKQRNAQAIADAKKETDAARAAWEAAQAAKHKASGDKSLTDQVSDAFKAISDLPMPKLPEGMDAGLDDIARKSSSAGTFSSQAAFGLGASTPLNEIKNNTAKTVDKIDALTRAINLRMGAAFG